MKLSEMRASDKLIADSGFTCLNAGEHVVQADGEGQLFIACSDGKHYLAGQTDFKNPDLLVGLTRG